MSSDPRSASGDTAPLCRNCGTPASLAYCPECGQETRNRLPTLREFVREAAFRYVAFDGRLWRTLMALAVRPGFLTREYFAGRRRRYIRPARLFLVMSLILFAVIRLTVTFADTSEPVADGEDAANHAPKDKPAGEVVPKPGSSERYGLSIDQDRNVVLKGLHGPLGDELERRLAHFNRLQPRDRIEQIVAGVLRYGPYAMFALLPAFAALQMLSYLGRTKRYPGRPRLYVEHLVYGAHLHTFLFLVLAIALVVPSSLMRWILAFWTGYYMLRAKHLVYGGSWLGSVVRSGIVGAAYLVLMALAMAGLLLAAILWR